jgi:inorganic pyrophosphatase
MRLFSLAIGVFALAAACGRPQPAPHASSSSSSVTYINEFTLRGEKNFISGYEIRNANGTYNMAVEIPTGTNHKWETCTIDSLANLSAYPGCTAAGREMVVEVADGKPRLINYLGSLGNYGAMPKTLSGDGDPLDAVAIGQPLERGTVIAVKVVGLLRCIDSGEGDDKVIAIAPSSPLYASVSTAGDLERLAPKAAEILRVWYESYKGPGVVTCQPLSDERDAARYIEDAAQRYASDSRERR